MPQPATKRHPHHLVLVLLLLVAAGTYWFFSQSLETPPEQAAEDFEPTSRCGSERWPVKTLSDDRASSALQSNPRVASIQQLATQPRPPWYHEAGRSTEEEVQYIVEAWISAYKVEPDRDIHVLLHDGRGWQMVAEFPHPSCVARLSAREPLAQARQELQSLLPAVPHSSFIHVNIPVRIRGVFFFDRPHGQAGHALNSAELHPVLEVTRRN